MNPTYQLSAIAQLANWCEKTVKKPSGTTISPSTLSFVLPVTNMFLTMMTWIISSPSYSWNQLFFWMKSKTGSRQCGMSKSQSQHSPTLSIALWSLTKLLWRRQLNRTSIFVLCGRLSWCVFNGDVHFVIRVTIYGNSSKWDNMILVSLFSSMKLEWMITQIFRKMIGLHLSKHVCATQLFCEVKNIISIMTRTFDR